MKKTEWGNSSYEYTKPTKWRFNSQIPATKKEDMPGYKTDEDKVQYRYLTREALEGTSKVLMFGANKYTPRNWEKGMSYMRVYDALMRHMFAWRSGEDLDPETGINHLHHAACCLLFLQTYVERNYDAYDDRPKESVYDANNRKK